MATLATQHSIPRDSAHIFSPREGYDRVASFYDQWKWQSFWDANEAPLVSDLIDLVDPTYVLDVGVGTGRYLHSLCQKHIEGIGIDLSQAMLSIAEQRPILAGRLQQGDVRDLPFASSSFDAAIAARVFSHVKELDIALAEVARVLSPGGTLIYTDIDGAHKYDSTRIKTPIGDFHIEVNKRGIREVIKKIEDSGLFEVKYIKQLSAINVGWLPPASSLRSIDRTGTKPVSFIMLLQRNAN
jgi:ubiquinone/menaquinone biosynthesis C-methylase UbiE